LGPFTVCTYVYPNIRVFRRVIAEKTAEREKEAREYFERERQVQAEYEAKLKRQAQERVLLKEAEAIAYRREHAVELAAEKIARAVWPEEIPAWPDEDMSGLDDHPF
jgi:hypothetical protein